MRARVVVFGHALHPMLIVFPLGLLATSVVWDIVRLATGNGLWGFVSYWTIVAGIIGGLLAAIPGFVDWMSIPSNTRAHRVGLWHMGLNVVVLALFAFSLVLRAAAPAGYPIADWPRFLPGWAGVVIALFSAWFGGELVEQLGVSVEPDAGLQAPSSLHNDGHPIIPAPSGPQPQPPAL